jgi:hypothetical protein
MRRLVTPFALAGLALAWFLAQALESTALALATSVLVLLATTAATSLREARKRVVVAWCCAVVLFATTVAVLIGAPPGAPHRLPLLLAVMASLALLVPLLYACSFGGRSSR